MLKTIKPHGRGQQTQKAPTGKRYENINPELALPERLKGYIFGDIKPFIDYLRLDNADLGLKRFNNNKNIG